MLALLCYACYYAEKQMRKPASGHTSIVRRYVRDHYVRPARRAGRNTFRVVVGEVHTALGLKNRVPLVCNALSSRKFLEENSLRMLERTGPPSGQSTTVVLTYEILDSQDIKSMDSLRALRGAGAAVFAELGGGESFLRGERGKFFAPSALER
jgi:hypothetical protein